MTQTISYSKERDYALALARSGQYADWHGICRKMFLDGWTVTVFTDRVFMDDVDLACSIARASRSRRPRPSTDLGPRESS
jgi:hypothetical protein